MYQPGHVRQLIADLAAGAGVSAAVALAIASVFKAPVVIVLCAAGIVFLRVYCSLRRLHSVPRFALASFQPAALEFEPDGFAGDRDLFELDAVAASMTSHAPPAPKPGSWPTVRELQASISERLGAQEPRSDVNDPPPSTERDEPADGADQLRAAMRDLRRSIG